ncbi:MAG TPA: hypothetical protein VFP98_07655, partial [Candidatus Polarisedimenticolia bacterium]|nr:hypothetical protein [Candidatus Polarisedimenticolia bacterium]
YGGEGELAQSVTRWREYFESQARVWEMQAFLKARPVAGDLAAGRTAVEQIEALVFRRAAGADLGREVAQTKEKLERQAALRPGVDIKNGPGGLTAIQFAIQYLQLRHGIASPTHKRTTRVLATLRAAGALDEEAYRTFFTGYRFLRRLEHRIRLIHGRALSSLPASGDALEELARSMGGAQDAGKASGRLLEEVALRMARIEETYRRVIERSPRVESVGV